MGLVWAGSPDNKIDRPPQSSGHSVLAPLMTGAVAGVDLVSLQVGPQADQVRDLQTPGEGQPGGGQIVFDCNGKVDDFADTAAVIAQLDLVIGVDTAAIMHLAAALGETDLADAAVHARLSLAAGPERFPLVSSPSACSARTNPAIGTML